MTKNQIILQRILTAVSMALLGATIAIGLCKFCPGFWAWIVGGILK